uniref:Phosphatidylinositol-4,5-bisphosphate 4-phosphatase n=1 Tax=Parascaris univalens TaxID=6257 RepID=A0A915BY93_PARUN
MMNVTENAEASAEKAPQSNYLDVDHVQKRFASLRAGNQMGTPPPPYSLTSPCLPPIDTQQQRWSPEPPPSFESLPAYPAGPKLEKMEYPKNIPGPTYACPHCQGRFLYHRPTGLVICPFCHSAISIGKYIRCRALWHIFAGIFLLLASITFSTIVTMVVGPSQMYFLVTAALIAFWALVVILRAAHLHSNYKETERIEF